MGFPKLRVEWVINSLCDGNDAQDGGECEHTTSGLCSQLQSYSSMVSSAQSAQSKWDTPATGT